MSLFASGVRFVLLPFVRQSLFIATFAICIAMLWANSAPASVSYTIIGGSYTQNFDSLPVPTTGTGNTTNNNIQTATNGGFTNGWKDDDVTIAGTQVSIPGWYLWHPGNPAGTPLAEGGSSGFQRMRFGAGTVNTGAFMNFGAAGSTERALGGVMSNTLSVASAENYIGLRLTNNTGSTLGQFTLSYNGEQWRDGGNTTPVSQNLKFGYKVGAANVQDAGFTLVPSLQFTSPVNVNTGSGAGVDGNVAGRVAINATTVSGFNWAPGTDLWLRWTDLNDANNDHGLAIDDLSFSANVIPTFTWTGGTNADWNNASNWNPNTGVPASGNIANFDNAGNGNTTIGLGGTRPIGYIQFNPGAAAYTVGSSSEQFDVDAGGSITLASGVTTPQTINAKVNGLGALTITNSSTAGLTMGSDVTASSLLLNPATGNVTFSGNTNIGGAIAVSGAGTATFNAPITNGTGTGSISDTMTTGVLVLNAANTYSGGTTITMSGSSATHAVLIGNDAAFGTGPITPGGSVPALYYPIGADRTIANDVGTAGAPAIQGFFFETASASVDPTGPHNITLTGDIYFTNSRTITNNLVGATLTLGSAGSPKTISRNNNLTFQSQAQVQPSGGVTVINDNIAASTSALLNEQTVTFQNGLKATMNGTIGGNGNIVIQTIATVPGTVVHFNRTGMYGGTGTMTVQGGAVAHFDQPDVLSGVAPVTVTGTHSNGDRSTLNINAANTITGALSVRNGGVAYVNAPTTYGGALNIDASAATGVPTGQTLVVNNTLSRAGANTNALQVKTGTLSGNNGTIAGPVQILQDANGASHLAPGNTTTGFTNGAGKLNINYPNPNPPNPNYALDFSSGASCTTCNFDVELGGTTPGTGFDQVEVTGDARIADAGNSRGILNVSLINSYAPSSNVSFEILKSTALTAGLGFATVNFNVPNPADWSVRYTGTSVFLDMVVAAASTTAADYVTYRKNDGTDAGYVTFRKNFSNSPGSGSGLEGGAVPEPASVMLVLLSIAGLSATRRRNA